jgi:lantibiotic modifying enzyme
MMSLPWRSLLSGEAAKDALAAVKDIAAVTSRGAIHYAENLAPEAFPTWESALSGGRAGQCLLHAYLAFHGAGDDYSDTAIRLLDQAADAAAVEKMSSSLYLGFSGIAWSAAHLTGHLFTEEEDGNIEVDEMLLQSLLRAPWDGTYNLFNGLVGLGIYALERIPRPSAVRCLEAVIAQLASRAEHTPEGATFFSPVETLDPKYHQVFPRGTYVLGMAQGIPGVIALLGAACHAGIATREARPLLDATVSWLLAREQPPDSDYRFPHYYSPGVEPYRSRLAWCFGDLGIAASLLMAARGANEPVWESEARRIARAAASRRMENNVLDAGLCHGSAGVGHVFNRLYQATGDKEFGKAALFWFHHALGLRNPGVGIGGFRMSSGSGEFDEPGFLVGATGIGLALLAAVSDIEPAWDRALLISLPASSDSLHS